nr:hypothetical protein KV8917_900023 [Klebsiella variicola]
MYDKEHFERFYNMFHNMHISLILIS